MKKALFLMLLSVFTCLILAGCGSDADLCLHDWQEIADDKYLISPASCQSTAIYNSVCSKCGELGSPFEYGEGGAHLYIEKATADYLISEATCTQYATYRVSCEYCGKMGVETFTAGVMKEHSSAKRMTADTLLTNPTCTTAACYQYCCSECGTMLGGSFEFGPKLPHEDVHGDYICDMCELPLKRWDDVPTDDMADIDKWD